MSENNNDFTHVLVSKEDALALLEILSNLPYKLAKSHIEVLGNAQGVIVTKKEENVETQSQEAAQ